MRSTDARSRTRWWRLLLVLAALSLVAAACGGDDDDEADETSDTSEVEDTATTEPDDGTGEVELGQEVSGTVTFADGPVTRSAGIVGASTVSFQFENDAGSAAGLSYRIVSGTTTLLTGNANPGETIADRVVVGAGFSGNVDVVIQGEGSYTFVLNEDPQDDGGSGGDAGDDLASPTTVSARTINGVLGGSDRADFYAVGLQAGASVDVRFANDATSSSRARLEMIFNGNRLDLVDVNAGGEDGFVQVLAADAAGEYIFKVTASGEEINYTVAITATGQNDGGISGDAPPDIANPRLVEAGEALPGLLGNDDNADVYTVDTAPGAVVSVDLANAASSGGRVRIELFLDGDRVDLKDLNPGGSDTVSHISSGDAGTYFIKVTSSSMVTYTFTVNAGVQMDGGQEGDAPDNSGAARVIVAGDTEYPGMLGGTDGEDFYSFSAPAATGSVTVTNDPGSGGRMRLEALVDGDRIGLVDLNPGATETLDLTELVTGGTVVLRFSSASVIDYTFTAA